MEKGRARRDKCDFNVMFVRSLCGNCNHNFWLTAGTNVLCGVCVICVLQQQRHSVNYTNARVTEYILPQSSHTDTHTHHTLAHEVWLLGGLEAVSACGRVACWPLRRPGLTNVQAQQRSKVLQTCEKLTAWGGGMLGRDKDSMLRVVRVSQLGNFQKRRND